MKRLTVYLMCLAFALLAPPAAASDKYEALLSSTGSSARVSVGANSRVSLQCNQPAFVCVGDSTVTCATTAGVKVNTDQLYDIRTSSTETHVAVYPFSTSVDCKVFRSTP
jgi:hypothetical protein